MHIHGGPAGTCVVAVQPADMETTLFCISTHAEGAVLFSPLTRLELSRGFPGFSSLFRAGWDSAVETSVSNCRVLLASGVPFGGQMI